MKFLILFFGMIVFRGAMADITAFEYHLGATKISEDDRKIVIHSTVPVTVEILPGGTTWPFLSLDETGYLYAGNLVVNPATGLSTKHPAETLVLPHGVGISEKENGFQFRQSGATCFLSLQQLGLAAQRPAAVALKNANIIFSSTADALLALVTQFGSDGSVSNYLIEKIDPQRCTVPRQKNIGNPDLLVELGYSKKAGWWITGSIEQSLMQSSDGRNWRNVSLPPDLSGLVSAYFVDTEEIWLAAILPEQSGTSPYLLVYSNDAGKNWRNITTDDPVLKRLPPGWLEGQRRGNRIRDNPGEVLNGGCSSPFQPGCGSCCYFP